MRPVVVLGSGGMLGHMVYTVLTEAGINVRGIGRKQGPCVDVVCDHDYPERLVSKHHIAINCIGVLNEAAEQDLDRATRLNAVLPHAIANNAHHLIHVSTDCVFSGERRAGRYRVNERSDAVSKYGITKAIGEIADRLNVLTLRQSIIGPALDPKNIGFLNWVLSHNEPSINGYTTHSWNGVTTLHLARRILNCVKAINEGRLPHGLRHVVTEQAYTKHHMVGLVANAFGLKFNLKANSPLHCNRTLETDPLITAAPPLEDQLDELAEWMRAHASLYPHYSHVPGLVLPR